MYKVIHLGLIKCISLKRLFNFFENIFIFFFFTPIAAYPSGTGVGIQ